MSNLLSLADRFFRSPKPSVRLATLGLPPRPLPRSPRKPLCVVAIVKDEGKFISEWVTFYRLQGAELIVYDDSSTDQTRSILDAYAAEGACRVIDWDRFCINDDLSPQMLAYAHAIVNYGDRYRWMAFLDADEFLFSPVYDRLTDALELFADLPALCFPWRMFGTSGIESLAAGDLVTEKFIMRGADQLKRQVKCAIDPSRVTALRDAHWFFIGDLGQMAFNEHRALVRKDNFAKTSGWEQRLFQLNHYFTRSIEDFSEKKRKGDVAGKAHTSLERFDELQRLIEAKPLADRSIQRFVPTLRASLR